MPRPTVAELLAYCRRLEAQVIELAAQVERMRIDLASLSARVTVRPPGER